MITEASILSQLDNFKLGPYCQFIYLGDPSSYLIDSRLNIFTDNNGNWAIAGERLGFNPRAGSIQLDIYYFGNCLINLEEYNGHTTNSYTVWPIDWDNFNNTVENEVLLRDAKCWIARGKEIELSHNLKDYKDAEIELKEYEPGEISLEEVGRLLILKHRELLRATDDELYKSIPGNLQKILVIDEWYHRDFIEFDHADTSEDEIKRIYEFNKNLGNGPVPMDYGTFANLFREQQQANAKYNDEQLNNKPSAYETWQLIAKVISTGDVSLYRTTQVANSHWKNWPDSGGI